MGPVLVFVLGGMSALVGRKHVRRVYKGTLKTLASSQQAMVNAAARAREDYEDALAEVKQAPEPVEKGREEEGTGQQGAMR